MKTHIIKKIISIFILTFVVNLTFGKSNEVFKVLSATGDIKVQQNDKQNQWESVTTGVKLLENDKIKIAGNSYLGLIHSSGKTIEIKQEGTYSVNDLAKGIKPVNTVVSQQLADFMIDVFAKVDDPSNLTNYQGSMSVTGSVERNLALKAVKVFMPKATNIINPNMTFTWYNIEEATGYMFNLMDKFARPVFEKEMTDTTITVNLNELNIDKEDCYFWNVYCINEPKIQSQEYCVFLLSDKTAKTINDTLNILKNEIGDDKTALNKLVIASYYEKNNLLNEAMQYYQFALNEAPDVENYKKAYAMFLIRMGLFDKARMVWKK